MLGRFLEYRVRRWVLIIICCLAVCGGVVYARVLQLDDFRWLWLVVSFAVISLRRHNVVTVLFLMLLCFGIGWWRGSEYMDRLAMHRSLHYQKVVVIGRAMEEAVYGERYQLEFSLDKVQVIAPVQTPLVGSLTIRGFGEPAIYKGDIVRVTGKLYPALGNDIGRISFAELKVLKRDSFWLNDLRRKFAAGMQSALPEPSASFALGLLIGQRNTLPEETNEQLRHVGLTHIIAVSGYNLTIIVLACRRLLAKRSKFQATAACLALIGLFLLATDAAPPIVRAAIISLIGIGAWYYGRNIRPLVLLLVAATVTIIANPIYLWSSVSWWLSFLAFFGVLVLAPLITKRILGDREPHMLLGILIESACASILVLPYILFIFGEMSLVSLPANLLVVPLIPFAMLFGLFAGLAGMIVPAIAGWVAWPGSVVTTFMLDMANLLSRVPNAYIEDINFPLSYMLVSYVVIGFVCFILWSKVRKSAIITEKIEEQKINGRTFQVGAN
ncbi:ComEC/Rec2 family competence protein [Candidatus Saccharibacteria bacterium]|nr:ComEC/Rec2 family competence protein [Candidatus Saccharibacteria bacterium]